jgi:fructose-1,6-bisphosphatase II
MDPTSRSTSSASSSRRPSPARRPWGRATATSPTRRPSRPCAGDGHRPDRRHHRDRRGGARRRADALHRREGRAGRTAERAGPFYPQVDIAVDPLEGTNLCATGEPNAIAVLAASDKGGLLHAPDLYMEKLVVGPSSKHAVSLDAPVAENLRASPAASARRRGPRRHRAGSAAPREADRGHPRDRRAHPADRRRRPVGRHRRRRGRQRRARRDGHRRRPRRRADGRRHAVPERRDLRAPRRQQARARGALPAMGITDFKRSTRSKDLASSDNIIFAATGVTDGTLMKGVRFFGDGVRTSSIVMQSSPARIRFIDTIHVEQTRMVRVRSSDRRGRQRPCLPGAGTWSPSRPPASSASPASRW